MNTDCLFCKIIKGEIPATKVYEDDTTLAFMDIHPVNPGHTLVIPKTHVRNIFEAQEEILTQVMRTVKKVAHGIQNGLEVSDLNIVMNNGAHAGQTVFHAHIHLIPRHEGDGHTPWHGKKPYENSEQESIANSIKKAL